MPPRIAIAPPDRPVAPSAKDGPTGFVSVLVPSPTSLTVLVSLSEAYRVVTWIRTKLGFTDGPVTVRFVPARSEPYDAVPST